MESRCYNKVASTSSGICTYPISSERCILSQKLNLLYCTENVQIMNLAQYATITTPGESVQFDAGIKLKVNDLAVPGLSQEMCLECHNCGFRFKSSLYMWNILLV